MPDFKEKWKKRKQRLVSSNNFPEIENKETPEKHDKPLLNLYRAIRALSEIDRAIIILYLEEKSYKEIAKRLNISVKTVETHIGRALKTLSKLIKSPSWFLV